MKKILFFSHTASLGGAGLCLYQLVRILQSHALPVVVLIQSGPLADMLRSAGVSVHIEPRLRCLMTNTNTRSSLHLRDFLMLMQVRRSVRLAEEICRRERPDTVHINTAVLLHLAAGARRAGIKHVLLHVREHWDVRAWDIRERIKNIVTGQCVDRIIAISQTASKQFGFEGKTEVVYDWPDFEGRDGEIDLERGFTIRPDQKILLVLGGRTSIKGTKIALQAMNQVKDRSAVMFVPGGRADADPRKQIIRRILRRLSFETYGLSLDRLQEESEGRIILAPPVKELKRIIQRSAIVLCPFTTPHFAMPALEAGLLGVPVIASDNGHAREVIVNGETGIIVPPGDVPALATAINQLLECPQKSKQFGRTASRVVVDRFDKEHSIAQMKDIFL